MKFKNLGNTQIKIPAIGQGMGAVEPGEGAGVSAKRIDALRLGIELGMNFIDTAEAYGRGYSEELVGRAVAGNRDKVFIASKVSPENLSSAGVKRSLEGSLNRLKTGHIDLYQVHWTNPRIPLDETMRAMESQVKEGKVRYIGVCNFNLRELKQAQACLKEFALASVQQEYNLLDRTIENNVLPYCDKNRITLVAYSPLIQGKIFAGDGKAEGIKKIADKYNKSPAQVALNWLVSHPSVIAIPKAADPVHIRENAASCDFALSKDDIDALNNIFKQEILHVPVGRIRVVEDARENRKIYKTLDEALGNKFGLTPSPSELADDIRNGEALKPVRVERTSDNTGRFDYDLVEGRIRYWAWVIAYNAEKPVPVYLRSA